MNKIKNIPLKILFPFFVGIATVCILVISSSFQTWILRKNVVKNASEYIQVSAANIGNILAEEINSAGQVVRIYSYLAVRMTTDNIVSNEKKREFLMSELKV